MTDTDIARAREYLVEAEDDLANGHFDSATARATLGTGYAVLAHLDAVKPAEIVNRIDPGLVLPVTPELLDEDVRDFADRVRDHGGATSGRDDHAQGVVPGADLGRGTTNAPSPVSSDAKIGTGDLGAGLIYRLIGVLSGRHDVTAIRYPEAGEDAIGLGTTSVANFADEIADALLEDGWRPPANVGVPYLATIAHSLAAVVAKSGRSDLGGWLAEVAIAITTGREWPVLAPITLTGFRSEADMDAARRAGWRPPLPDGGQDLAEQVVHEIRNKLDWHQWPGCDWTNGSLFEVAEVATAAVMPFLEDPPAPRVFFPGDTVPAGLWVSYRTPKGLAAAMGAEDWMATDGAVVELNFPSLADWQAVVDRARTERDEAEKVRALRLHLASVHKNAAAFDLPASELEDVHNHDHTGPGGIRTHDISDRSDDEATARAVAEEADRG